MDLLSTEFLGFNLRNPLISAAGPNGRTGKLLKKMAEGGAGAVVTKSIGARPFPKNLLPRPRLANTKLGLLLTDPYSEIDYKEWKKEIRIAKEGGVPVIASIQSQARDPEADIEILAPAIEDSGADAIELSAFGSCSNVVDFSGIAPIQDPQRTYRVVKAAKKATGLPVISKLAPEPSNFLDLLKAAESAGADAIAMRDTIVPAISFNLETGKPIVMRGGGLAWLPEVGGMPIKYNALAYVVEAVRRVKVPVVGIGGISTWEDAVEMIMAGATCVGICTAAIVKGPNIFSTISEGMKKFLIEKGYKSIDEIRGIGAKFVEEIWSREVPLLTANVIEEKCTGCRLCKNRCLYEAIVIKEDGKAFVDKDLCCGCGLCVSLCPANAIELRESTC